MSPVLDKEVPSPTPAHKGAGLICRTLMPNPVTSSKKRTPNGSNSHERRGKRSPSPSPLWGGVGEGLWSRPVKAPSNRRSDRGTHGGFIHVVEADDDQAGAAHFAGSPGAVEILVDAGADALDQKAHRLAGDIGKAL